MEWIIKKISDMTPSEEALYISRMSDRRREDIKSMSSDRRRRETVLGEALARELYFKRTAKEAKISRTDKGAPFIEDSPFFISIAHSGDYAVAAMSDAPVGIDIEKIKERDLSVARKFSSDEDMRMLEDPASALINFYKIWTAKEAYFKKLGTGISSPKSVSYRSLAVEHFFHDDYIITITK